MRLNLVLAALVMGTAFWLVQLQYESRRLYVANHRAEAQARRLEEQRDQLEVEFREQATPQRLQAIAKNDLHMLAPNPALTHYLGSRVEAPISQAAPKKGGKP